MMARHPHGKLLSDEVIAKRSGLTVSEVVLLGSALKWEVSVEVMEAFSKACNADLCNRTHLQRIYAYLGNNPKLLHLRNDPGWGRRWRPILLQLKLIKDNGH